MAVKFTLALISVAVLLQATNAQVCLIDDLCSTGIVYGQLCTVGCAVACGTVDPSVQCITYDVNNNTVTPGLGGQPVDAYCTCPSTCNTTPLSIFLANALVNDAVAATTICTQCGGTVAANTWDNTNKRFYIKCSY
jgi:hypothetical protein